jgi:hypothetical protein
MDNVVVLAAGKSTRLNGYSKLLVQAAGTTVLEWHMRALKGALAGVVVRPGESGRVYLSGWRGPIVETDDTRGPARALERYLVDTGVNGPITVVYGDTVLPELPNSPGSWVGVAEAPSRRVWDYHNGIRWTRGATVGEVCIGLYHFDDAQRLHDVIRSLRSSEMIDVLEAYGEMKPLIIEGWQDTGDFQALGNFKGYADTQNG